MPYIPFFRAFLLGLFMAFLYGLRLFTIRLGFFYLSDDFGIRREFNNHDFIILKTIPQVI